MSTPEPPVNLATPDLTPAQIIAGVTSILVSIAGACVVLFQLDLTGAQQGALTVIITGIVALTGAVWMHADAKVRHGRAIAQAEVRSAQINATAPPIFLPAPADPAPSPIVPPKRSRVPRPAAGA
jgi:hypothetical protein